MLLIKDMPDFLKLVYLIVEIELAKEVVNMKSTYGFPIELSEDMISKELKSNIKLDKALIEFFEQQHKDRSKNNRFKHKFSIINS